MKMRKALAALLALALAAATAADTDVRIKDIARFRGYSDNELTGLGVVFGLRGTGDGNQILFTAQAISNMLAAQGIQHDRRNIRTRNVASVIVTATLPPFAKPGQRIDINVASAGDATSLQGGTLLLTELRAANGDVYATAQGPLLVGGFSAGGAGTTITQNVPTAAIIPGGATVRREVLYDLQTRGGLTLVLSQFDFTTAVRIAEAINEKFSSPLARCGDGGSVDIVVPSEYRGRVIDFMASIESITIDTDQRAAVVVNERTGTVVIGKDVKVSTCAIAHGNLTIQVSTAWLVSQPPPFSERGQTVVVPQTDVTAAEETTTGTTKGTLALVQGEGASIGEIVQALNALGVAPRDIISILQAMKTQGALKAELKVI